VFSAIFVLLLGLRNADCELRIEYPRLLQSAI